METVTAPRTLTIAGVRAEIYASHAEADAAANGDGPDTLVQAAHHEAYFILDRYGRSEGWDTKPEEIEDLHEALVQVGIGAARAAMIELAAWHLANTERIES
jgi:hypothetical protein